MDDDTRFYDFADFLQSSSRGSVSSVKSSGSELWNSSTPATSPPSSERMLSTRSSTDINTVLDLSSPVTIAFTKGSKLFKLKYSRIEICKDRTGSFRCIELSDVASISGSFIHTFASAKRPIPHLEEPSSATFKPLRVSFLEDQMVQVAQTIFTAQPRYVFEKDSDCAKFQEAVLGFSVLFVAGIAEIVSKGRGEEAISQCLRICRYTNGVLCLLFFANSQRKEKRRYTAITFDTIESFDVPKKPTKPVHLKLASDKDSSEQMKSLSITFIDSVDTTRFVTFLQAAGLQKNGR